MKLCDRASAVVAITSSTMASTRKIIALCIRPSALRAQGTMPCLPPQAPVWPIAPGARIRHPRCIPSRRLPWTIPNPAGANAAKTSPKPKRGAQKGAPKAAAQDKTALLARMKAAAAKKT
ncbi:hypothetical protein MASR1M65_04180 [Saprospiraceae bacterium]